MRRALLLALVILVGCGGGLLLAEPCDAGGEGGCLCPDGGCADAAAP